MIEWIKGRKVHIQVGLKVGAVGFLVGFGIGNECCIGSMGSLALGAAAGTFTWRETEVGTRENTARLGAQSATIA